MPSHLRAECAAMLRDYSETLGNRSCNDKDWPVDWTLGQRANFIRAFFLYNSGTSKPGDVEWRELQEFLAQDRCPGDDCWAFVFAVMLEDPRPTAEMWPVSPAVMRQIEAVGFPGDANPVSWMAGEIARLRAREAEIAPLVERCRVTDAAYHATMREEPTVGEVEDYVRRGIAACDAHGSAVNALADHLLARPEGR